MMDTVTSMEPNRILSMSQSQRTSLTDILLMNEHFGWQYVYTIHFCLECDVNTKSIVTGSSLEAEHFSQPCNSFGSRDRFPGLCSIHCRSVNYSDLHPAPHLHYIHIHLGRALNKSRYHRHTFWISLAFVEFDFRSLGSPCCYRYNPSDTRPTRRGLPTDFGYFQIARMGVSCFIFHFVRHCFHYPTRTTPPLWLRQDILGEDHCGHYECRPWQCLWSHRCVLQYLYFDM